MASIVLLTGFGNSKSPLPRANTLLHGLPGWTALGGLVWGRALDR